MPDNTLLVGLLSALITAISVLAGVIISTRVQLHALNQTHRQAVRDDKRTRIRQYYAKIYWAAYTQLSVAKRMPIVVYAADAILTSDNPVVRSDKLMDEVRQANAQTQEALAILILEGGSDDIVGEYYRVCDTFNGYLESNNSNHRHNLEELNASFENLRDVMKKRYTELEKLA